MMDKFETKPYRLSRKLAIAENAFEYLISILVTGSFLARITTSLGFSDSLTGVLTAISSLGCIFQLASLFIRTKKVKPLTLVCTLISELLFLCLYVIPVTSMGSAAKTRLFVFSLTFAYLSAMVVSAKKKTWFISLVDDKKRGAYSANNEVVSLIVGISYSFAMGKLIDNYMAKGELNRAFLICAVIILGLLVFQLLSQVFCLEEKTVNARSGEHFLAGVRSIVSDKTILSLTVVLVLYRVGICTATSFYGTYQIKELGFSQTFVAVLAAIAGVLHMALGPVMGRYADRNSFAKMECICLGFLTAGFLFASFATPSNGKIMFILYYVFNGIAMAGANSAVTNLVFDYVPAEKCADALAITQSVSGLAGFLATLAAGLLVDRIQENGNRFLGLSIYAQQVTSIIGAVVTAGCIVYILVRFVRKKEKSAVR